jgi:hypothetical protein
VKILNATNHATWSEIKGAAAEGADATIALPAGLSQLTLLVRRLLGDATPQRDGLS